MEFSPKITLTTLPKKMHLKFVSLVTDYEQKAINTQLKEISRHSIILVR